MDRLRSIIMVIGSVFDPLSKVHAAVALSEAQDMARNNIFDSGFIGFSIRRKISKAAVYSLS